MRPTSATTLQRPELAALANEYAEEQTRSELIADKVLPIFNTPEQAADYPVIPKEAVLKLPRDIKRAPRAGYARGSYEFENGNFSCEEYGFEEPVDDVEAKLYARYFQAEEQATKRATGILMRMREKRVADYLFSTSTFSASTAAVTNEWSKAADADIIADAKAARRAVKDASGLEANGVILSDKVVDHILESLQFLDHVKYTDAMLLKDRAYQQAAIAKFLGVENLFIGKAKYDSAKKGQSFSAGDIWDDEYVLFGRFASNPQDLSEPCVGRSFLWTADSPTPIVTESYREESTRSNIIRVRHNMDEVGVFLACGYLLSNISE